MGSARAHDKLERTHASAVRAFPFGRSKAGAGNGAVERARGEEPPTDTRMDRGSARAHPAGWYGRQCSGGPARCAFRRRAVLWAARLFRPIDLRAELRAALL